MLAKPRLNGLVVASALAGYAMAGGDTSDVVRVCATLLGTGLVAGGASAFNQVLERDSDALMRRTRLRPLPDGRLLPREGLVFGTALSALGLTVLAVAVNLLSAAVALATLASYALVYTPLKRRTQRVRNVRTTDVASTSAPLTRCAVLMIGCSPEMITKAPSVT